MQSEHRTPRHDRPRASPRPRGRTADPALVTELTDDGSRTLVRTDSGDAYHSGSGAIAETRRVYLENGGVVQRLRRGVPTKVLEVGLGTGMGLLLTLDAAGNANASLSYVAIENGWIPASVWSCLAPESWPVDPALVRGFRSFRESLPAEVGPGVYRWRISGKLDVEIHVDDAKRCAATEPAAEYDAIYFDPFAPHSQPELWRPPMLGRMFACLRPGGRLVTYCVSRPVRETLRSVGFAVQRAAGPPGGKRDVLIAERPTMGSPPGHP